MNVWETLGIECVADEGAIRRAYAARVKQWRPDTHPQEFVRLREAYEAALHWARCALLEARDQEEAAQEEEAQDEPAREAPPPIAQPVIEAAVLPEPPAAPLPTADDLIRELARCYSTQGEHEAVMLMRQQYEAVSRQTIDARLDWEAVLLDSLLGANTPPLALLFEGDRLLGWRQRDADVAQMFGSQHAERLRRLVEASHEAAFLRFFSPNLWQRRLFGTARVPWFGMANQVEAARHTVKWWGQLALDCGTESLAGLLDPRVQRRLAGLVLLSADVLFALLMAFLSWPEVQVASTPQRRWSALGGAALTFALVLPLPLLARWAWGTWPVQRAWEWRHAVARVPLAVRSIVVGVLLIGSVIALDVGGPWRVAGIAILSLAAAVLLVLTGIGLWMLLRLLEQLLLLPWLWLQRTWGVHAFRCLLEGQPQPDWRAQLAHLPRAAAAGWRERRAQRKARIEQERRERALAAASGGRSFNWWWVFWGIIALQALARLAK